MPVVFPIPGTTKDHRLVENFGAADVSLTDEDVARIEGMLAKIEIKGARYNPTNMKFSGR